MIYFVKSVFALKDFSLTGYLFCLDPKDFSMNSLHFLV